MGEFVNAEQMADGVRIIRLDRPPMNALSAKVLAELEGEALAIGDDQTVRAVVISGGDRVFCAGADVKEMHEAIEAGRNPGREVAVRFRSALDAVADIRRPTIAAIVGFALGGGLELALACDFRIAAEDARLGFPEIQLGIFPGAGGTQRLPRLIGAARAKRMIFGGQPVSVTDALAWGLVDSVAPKEQVRALAVEEAGRLAAGASEAIGLAKRAIDGGLDGPLAAGLDLETRLFVDVYDTDDARVGVRSFVDHGPGKATFSGR